MANGAVCDAVCLLVAVVDILVADRHRKENDDILNEWQADISTSGMPIKKGPRTMDYDKQKGGLLGLNVVYMDDRTPVNDHP